MGVPGGRVGAEKAEVAGARKGGDVKRKSKSSGHGVSEFSTHHERKEQKEMKTKRLRNLISCLAVILAVTVFSVTDVLAWNWGVHAYIDDHLGATDPASNSNEIYGGVAPDLFNYVFDDHLYAMTHKQFMKVWAARSPSTNSCAFGFVSHNDKWGADSTAHHDCTSCGTKNEGYVIQKAEYMVENPPAALSDLLAYVASQNHDVAVEICHNFVEAAVDILVKQDDPAIGSKLMGAALGRSDTFPLLLVDAYAQDIATYLGMSSTDAAHFVTQKEEEFRESMVAYGWALMQDDETAVHLLSQQMASIAGAYLAANGITLPVPSDQLVPLIEQGIWAAHELCADDYKKEIDGTIELVGGELQKRGIVY
jgi:hypothetical protein